MERPFCLRVILGLIVLVCIAWGQMPQLEPYQHQNIALNIPQGWQVTKDDQTGTITITPDPEREDVPELQVVTLPYADSNEWLMENSGKSRFLHLVLQSMEQESGNKVQIIEEKDLVQGKGRLVLVETTALVNEEQIPAKVVLLLESSPQKELYIFAAFAAKPEDFENLGGVDLLTSVTTSAYPTISNPAQTSVPVELPLESTIIIDGAGSTSALRSSVRSADSTPIATGPIDREQLIGQWKTSEMSGTVDQRNFATNSNIDGSSLNYTFNADGTYTLLYKMSLWTGMLTSAIEITEVGSYTLTGNTLNILPDSYNGWSYFGSPTNKQNMTETNLPSRQYKVVTVENYIVLTGVCAKFQADPYCKDKKDNLNVLEFPLKRAS